MVKKHSRKKISFFRAIFDSRLVLFFIAVLGLSGVIFAREFNYYNSGENRVSASVELDQKFCVNRPSCCAQIVETHDAHACEDFIERMYCPLDVCSAIEGRNERCGWYWIWHDMNDDPVYHLGTNNPDGYGCMIGDSPQTMVPKYTSTGATITPKPPASPTPKATSTPVVTPTVYIPPTVYLSPTAYVYPTSYPTVNYYQPTTYNPPASPAGGQPTTYYSYPTAPPYNRPEATQYLPPTLSQGNNTYPTNNTQQITNPPQTNNPTSLPIIITTEPGIYITVIPTGENRQSRTGLNNPIPDIISNLSKVIKTTSKNILQFFSIVLP